jgi:hypothetical protein
MRPIFLISKAYYYSISSTLLTMTRSSLPTTTLLLAIISTGSVNAFQQQQHASHHKISSRLDVQQRTKSSTKLFESSKKSTQCRCPPEEEEDEESSLLDRREAAFAMLGGLWAAGTLPTALLFGNPEPAHAEYGIDAKMDFPDVVQGLSDRNNKQCLVESLGNRECLVYMEDADKFLYKGADTKILLERVETAASALANIPALVETKKWTQITGSLTGPMGQLNPTMTLIVKLSNNPEKSKAAAAKVKNDVFAIGAATSQKKGEAVLQAHKAATENLVAFLKTL